MVHSTFRTSTPSSEASKISMTFMSLLKGQKNCYEAMETNKVQTDKQICKINADMTNIRTATSTVGLTGDHPGWIKAGPASSLCLKSVN